MLIIYLHCEGEGVGVKYGKGRSGGTRCD